MATVETPTASVPPPAKTSTFDERLAYVMQVGQQQLAADLASMREKGILDEHGHVLIKELPADMMPGSDHDFGG